MYEKAWRRGRFSVCEMSWGVTEVVTGKDQRVASECREQSPTKSWEENRDFGPITTRT